MSLTTQWVTLSLLKMLLKQKISYRKTWLLGLKLLGVCLILIKHLPVFGLLIPIIFSEETTQQDLIDMVTGSTLNLILWVLHTLRMYALRIHNLENLAITLLTQMVDME